MKGMPAVFSLLLVGCLTPARPRDRVFTAEIGPEGGVLSGGGLTLTVPEGALSETQTLSVRVSRAPAPDGGVALSPVYQFEPEGLEFVVWAHVLVEIEDEAIGTMLWSTAEDPLAFEEVGLAAGGLAEGFTAHFSTMYVGEGACTDGPEETPGAGLETECYCRASDDQGDLLCANDPQIGQDCDISGFSGADGGPCAGFGNRPVEVPYCDCKNEDYGFLCPDAMVFEPYQVCPSDGGLNGFHGQEGEPCEGYTADNDLLSGLIETCQIVTVDMAYVPVPGLLEGCQEVASQAKKKKPVDRCSTAKDSWDQECLEILDSYGKDRTEACPDLGDPATAGSTIGNQLESVWADPDKGRLTQLEVPFGNKDDCRAGVPLRQRGPGRIDLAEAIEVGNTVYLRIGEIKPLTRSGLDLGWKEVFDCYAPAITEAGKKCSQGQMAPSVRAFCEKLDALGKTVALDEQPGVTWDLGNPFGDDLQVETCTEGLVAYTCP